MSFCEFKNVTYTLNYALYKSYIFNMYKQDLSLDNFQGWICHKTEATRIESEILIKYIK